MFAISSGLNYYYFESKFIELFSEVKIKIFKFLSVGEI